MKTLPNTLAICLLVSSQMTLALEAGDFLVRSRIINVNPDDSSSIVTVDHADALKSSKVSVDDSYTLDIDFTYMVQDHIGFELLLDLSSKHDVSGTGLLGTAAPGTILESRVLPPSLFAQYHFMPQAKIRPYIGLGLNYTLFFNEKSNNSLDSALVSLGLGTTTDVHLKSSWGLGGQIGMDIDITDNLFVNFDIKYIDIDTEARISTASGAVVRTNVSIDPLIIGVGLGMSF